MDSNEKFLYDKKYEKIKEIIENKKIQISEIKSVDDLFNSNTQTTTDIIKELIEHKTKGINKLFLISNHGNKCFVDIKRIYGLAQQDIYYYSSYEINYHNPKYVLEAFYIDLKDNLNKQYFWESGFNNDEDIKSIGEAYEWDD